MRRHCGTALSIYIHLGQECIPRKVHSNIDALAFTRMSFSTFVGQPKKSNHDHQVSTLH